MYDSLIAGFKFQVICKIKKGSLSNERQTENLTPEEVCECIFQQVDVNSDGMLTSYSKNIYINKYVIASKLI